MFDKRGRGITCVFCRDLHLTLLCSCLCSKDLSIGMRSLAENKKYILSRLSHKVLASSFLSRLVAKFILAGKRSSRCHTTTGFGEDVVVVETSFFAIGRWLNLPQQK